MGTLLAILLILFVALAIVVKVTERYSKPMEPAQQARLRKIITVLIFISLIIGIIQFAMRH